MSDTFDPAVLEAVLAIALDTPAARPEGPEVAGPVLLSAQEHSICASLATILPSYLSPEAVREVFTTLRTTHRFSGTTDLRIFHQRVARCRRCPNATASPTLPWGNLTNPRYVFVVSGPAQITETVDFIRGAEAMSVEQIAVVPLARCDPSTPDMETACAPYLHHELDAWAPAGLVCVGATVATTLLGAATIAELRHKHLFCDQTRIMVLPAPGYAKRESHLVREWYADLAHLASL